MKKIYTSPAIEIENIEVEQGIATSTVYSVFDLQGYDATEEDIIW